MPGMKHGRTTWLMTAGVLIPAFVARAAEDGYAAPAVEKPFPWIIVAVLAVGVLGIAMAVLKNSRRSHLENA
jgi:hypothetical protein